LRWPMIECTFAAAHAETCCLSANIFWMDGMVRRPANHCRTGLTQHAPVWAHETEYDEKVNAQDGHAVFEVCYESDDDYVAKAEQWLRLRADRAIEVSK
jgi:hypothetical protein